MFCSNTLMIIHVSVSILLDLEPYSLFISNVTVTVERSNRSRRHQGGQIQDVVVTFSLY